jgi:hypothetical protein
MISLFVHFDFGFSPDLYASTALLLIEYPQYPDIFFILLKTIPKLPKILLGVEPVVNKT